MTSFHLFEFAMVILVGLFWLQIFLRGIARRNFKFEYISYSLITVCFLEFYFTYVIWQDSKPVLALASFGLVVVCLRVVFGLLVLVVLGGQPVVHVARALRGRHDRGPCCC